MARYTICYLGHEGDIVDFSDSWFDCDDLAVDAAGQSDHPHQIIVLDGERIVAEFAPWPRRSP